MPGLNLGMSAGFAVPAPALPPSYAGSPSGATISARAYGIAGASAGSSDQGAGAAYGSVALTTVCAVALAWLWWTLPR